MSSSDAHAASHGAPDDAHAHNPHLAHHFDTPQQQFDAGKLGIWLFLLTEVLFFAGLFCAYTVYRSMNPEVFAMAVVVVRVLVHGGRRGGRFCGLRGGAWFRHLGGPAQAFLLT